MANLRRAACSPDSAGSGGSGASGPRPSLVYWHAWVDDAGISRQTRCTLENFELKGINPSVQPQWNLKQDKVPAVVTFSLLPVGWFGDWHENPGPQWITVLSGRWYVETMDGTRVEMGPGEIEFGEDQNCRADSDGRKGHISGTLGDEPCVLLVVSIDVEPTRASPCRFT